MRGSDSTRWRFLMATTRHKPQRPTSLAGHRKKRAECPEQALALEGLSKELALGFEDLTCPFFILWWLSKL
jgi:hypothetical protein